MLALTHDSVNLHRVPRTESARLILPLLSLLLALPPMGCGKKAGAPHQVSPPPPVTLRSGSELYESCLLCHSTREMQRGPILDGLPAWYVEHQLRKFRLGIRGRNPTNRAELLMGSTAGQLQSAPDIHAVASHIQSLPVPHHLLTVRGDPDKGRVLYAHCAPCHGDSAQGNKILRGPPLAGLEDWYQLDQLRKFKTRHRGYHPADTNGQIMAATVLALTDQDLRDVVHYVATELARAKAPQ